MLMYRGEDSKQFLQDKANFVQDSKHFEQDNAQFVQDS